MISTEPCEEERRIRQRRIESGQISLRDSVLMMTVWAVVLAIARMTMSTRLATCQFAMFLYGAFLVCLGSARWKLWMVFVGIILLWIVIILKVVAEYLD
jgi:hypothetical protein